MNLWLFCHYITWQSFMNWIIKWKSVFNSVSLGSKIVINSENEKGAHLTNLDYVDKKVHQCDYITYFRNKNMKYDWGKGVNCMMECITLQVAGTTRLGSQRKCWQPNDCSLMTQLWFLFAAHIVLITGDHMSEYLFAHRSTTQFCTKHASPKQKGYSHANSSVRLHMAKAKLSYS